jgi:type II secretory pathway component GspD/PulD (secretin)
MKPTSSLIVCACALLAAAPSSFAAAEPKPESKPAANAPSAPAAKAAVKPAAPAGVIRLRFVNADVSDVLQAISLKTRANIVYPAQLKKLVSLDVTATSVPEALGFATAAAGLVYRQVGQNYVVGPSSELRQLLEPFGEKSMVALSTMKPDEAVKLLNGALPYLTARPAGAQLALVGSGEDIVEARRLIAEGDRPAVIPVPAETLVLPVRYVSPANVAKTLAAMYPGVKAEAVAGTEKVGGAVGLSGPRELLERAKLMAAGLDLKTEVEQPTRVHRAYTVRYSSALELKKFLEKSVEGVEVTVGPEAYSPRAPVFSTLAGALQGAIASASGSGGGAGGAGGAGGGGSSSGAASSNNVVKREEGENAKRIMLFGTAREVDLALQMLAEVDVAPQQVMVEVRVVDTSPERAEELGLQWNWSPFEFLETQPGTAVNGFPQATRNRGFGSFSRVPFSFNAVLSAMVSRREAKILADPRIQVLDNEDANIFIGDTLRTQIAQAGIAGTTIQIFEFPVGIILLVRPRINEDGNITMRVHPVVSTITGIGANNLPSTSTREAETTVRVKDGETVVIGGLIRDEMTKIVQEVPILSKLPLVGELFRNRSTSSRRSEVLVFITPRIVKQQP